MARIDHQKRCCVPSGQRYVTHVCSDSLETLGACCGDLRFLPVNFDKPWATTLHLASVSVDLSRERNDMSSFKKYKCLTISEKQKVIESVEEALIIIDKAWRAVTHLTIHSCFKNSSITRFDDYVLVDPDIVIWGALSDAEIVTFDHNNTERDEDESEELTPVTLSEAKVSLNKLRNFSLQNHADADILQASFVLEKSIDKPSVGNRGDAFKILGARNIKLICKEGQGDRKYKNRNSTGWTSDWPIHPGNILVLQKFGDQISFMWPRVVIH
ncbi:hypothetical protein TNCV_1978021 [Trichonephila clavipes]|nr:hypothetical protein TNCV_1978021 [Trichonephila clavipes]